MSLFGSLMGSFDDDPFFSSHRSIMRQMNEMLANPFDNDPFFSGGPAFPALTHQPANQLMARQPPQPSNQLMARQPQQPSNQLMARQPQQQARTRQMRDPFSMLGFPNIGNMMQNFDQMAQRGDCHSFSSSSVMTMTTGPDGKPTVYQASSSSRAVPGGVRETRRTIQDGHSGTRKMAIGHHIGDRSHIIEREQQAGNLEERQEFINLEEEDAPKFDQEFRHHTQGGDLNSLEYRSRHRPSTAYRSRSAVPAIQSSSYRRRSRPMLSITAAPSEDRRRREREERRQYNK